MLILELIQHPYAQYVLYYCMGGVVFNAFYDFVVSKIGNEDLRFNMMERISIGLVWPVFTLIFIVNFIKQLFNGNNND